MARRTERIEMRTYREVAEAIDRARGYTSLSQWLEQAALIRLRAEGIEPDRSVVGEGFAPEPVEEYPRRPAPRMTGGRKKR